MRRLCLANRPKGCSSVSRCHHPTPCERFGKPSRGHAPCWPSLHQASVRRRWLRRKLRARSLAASPLRLSMHGLPLGGRITGGVFVGRYGWHLLNTTEPASHMQSIACGSPHSRRKIECAIGGRGKPLWPCSHGPPPPVSRTLRRGELVRLGTHKHEGGLLVAEARSRRQVGAIRQQRACDQPVLLVR